MRATPYVDFVMQSHLLSTAEVTAALGVAPDDVVADSPYGSPSHRSPAAKGLLPTNEVPSWRFREDSGILFTGMDERTYVTRIQVSRLVKRLIPFQDPLAALNRRLGELVVPWNDSLEIKYTSEVVDVEALNFLGAVGAMLVATFVDVADQLDEGPVTHAD